MKFNEIKNKTTGELQEQLNEFRIKLSKLKFDIQTNNLKDASQIKKTRTDIARVLTALRLK